MRDDDLYMISFSGGRTSAYMTDILLHRIPSDRVIVCFANTGKEEEKTLDFVHRCDRHWNGIIHWLEYDPSKKFRKTDYIHASRNGEPYENLIHKRKFLPNVMMRYCTVELKIRVIRRYMLFLGHRYWKNVVGIRYDEPHRWSRMYGIAEKEDWDIWLPLVEWKATKQVVLDYWKKMPFDLEIDHFLGNCDLCFLKGRNSLRRILTAYPEKADWWIEQEKKKEATFHKEFSYEKFRNIISSSPTLFDYEDSDSGCICNMD